MIVHEFGKYKYARFNYLTQGRKCFIEAWVEKKEPINKMIRLAAEHIWGVWQAKPLGE